MSTSIIVDEQCLETLSNDAKKILDLRRQSNDQKSNGDTFSPVVVEFSGSPKAGKSTTIDIVSHFFKRSRFRVWAPTEGASKRTPSQLKQDLVAFNCWSLNYAISEILLAYHNVDYHDLIILDRGPFDSLAWMGVLRERGEISDDEYEIVERYAKFGKWAGTVSKIFLFTCDPDVSMKRENDSKLTNRPGIAMNNEMLTAIRSRYEALEKELEEYPIVKIDTTHGTTQLSTSCQVAMEIISSFKT